MTKEALLVRKKDIRDQAKSDYIHQLCFPDMCPGRYVRLWVQRNQARLPGPEGRYLNGSPTLEGTPYT